MVEPSPVAEPLCCRDLHTMGERSVLKSPSILWLRRLFLRHFPYWYTCCFAVSLVRATCLVPFKFCKYRWETNLLDSYSTAGYFCPPPRKIPPSFPSLGLVTVFKLYSCVFTYLTEEKFNGSVICPGELRHLVAELRRVTISCVMSVRLSVRICQFGSHRTNFRGTWHWGLSWKYVEIIVLWLKWREIIWGVLGVSPLPSVRLP